MTRYSIFFYFAFLSSITIGQSLVVIDINETSISEDTIYVEIGNEEFDISVYAGLHNISNSTLQINVTRTELDVLPATSSYFCWGSCTGVTTSGDAPVITPSGSVTFSPNHLVPANESGFIFHYDPNNQIGTSLFKIQFFDINNTIDSANVFISITSSDVTSIKEFEVESVTAYPNPCNDVIYFQESQAYTLTNIMGQIISIGNDSKLDLTGVKSGYYFIKTEKSTVLILKE